MGLSEFLRWLQEEITEKQIEETVEKNRDKVYKPCWDLKICPYGVLVELFPLPQQVTRSQAIARNEHLKESLKKGAYSKKMTPVFQEEVESFNPLDYPETEDEIKFKNEACKHFGHICPVFFTGELLENSEELQRQKTDINALEKNEAAAKNVDLYSYKCETCGARLEDYEAEIVRERKSRNVRILCGLCRKKGKIGNPRGTSRVNRET